MLIIYTVSHFIVDFASGWALYHGAAYSEQGWFCVVLYAFLAFAMQMPLGACADKFNRNAFCAAAGCLLVGAACLLPASPLTVTVIAGFGNALFHLGGGIDVLNSSQGKTGPLGIFVSTGAFGIFYGCKLGHTAPHLALITAAAAALAAAAILLRQYLSCRGWRSSNTPLRLPKPSRPYLIAALCLFCVVILRSYLGFALDFSWKSAAPWGLVLLCALAAGKMGGGLLADRFGQLTVCLSTLSAAALFFLLSGFPWAGVLAVWLFNMTMPLTLGALALISPGCKGFAFGALTFGLFLGSLPHLLGCDSLPHTPITYAAAALLSLLLLWIGLKNVSLAAEC